MSKADAYIALDSERDYQETVSQHVLTIGEELLLLEEYVARARKEWTEEFTIPEVKTLEVVRKIGGIAVRCMENHGAIPREGF